MADKHANMPGMGDAPKKVVPEQPIAKPQPPVKRTKEEPAAPAKAVHKH